MDTPQRPEARDRSATRTAVGVASIVALLALTAVELVAPHDITVGAAGAVPIVAAWAFADRRLAMGVLALALVSRGLDAAIDDIPVGLAVLEVGSYVAVYLLVALAIDPAVLHRLPIDVRGRAPVPPAPAPAAPAAIPAPAVAALEPAIPASDASLPIAMRLTAREREVADLAARGLTAAQIAERLSIGRRTVETHLARAYSKLGVRSKRDLVARQLDRDLGAG